MCVLCRFVILVLIKGGNEKLMNTEETEKRARKNPSICKQDIGLLNFLRNITLTILTTFQIFVINYLINPQTLNDT